MDAGRNGSRPPTDDVVRITNIYCICAVVRKGEKMTKARKTVDRFDIETNYGYGWETEHSEYRLQDAKRSFNEYLVNVGDRCRVRLVKHREKKER